MTPCKYFWESGGKGTTAMKHKLKGREMFLDYCIAKSLSLFRLRMDIEEIIEHPGYNPVLLDNDFVLFK